MDCFQRSGDIVNDNKVEEISLNSSKRKEKHDAKRLQSLKNVHQFDL